MKFFDYLKICSEKYGRKRNSNELLPIYLVAASLHICNMQTTGESPGNCVSHGQNLERKAESTIQLNIFTSKSFFSNGQKLKKMN